MRNYGPMMPHGITPAWWSNPFLLLLIGIVTLVLILVVARLLFRRERQLVQDEIHENMDGEIHSMLFQAGGSLYQSRIRDNLGVSADDLAQALQTMEQRGEVQRTWIPSEYTYQVTLLTQSNSLAHHVQ